VSFAEFIKKEKCMTNELNLLNKLCIGDIVGSTKRMVIASTQKAERIPNESYAYWVTICYSDQERDPYVVWNIVARPEGFTAESGDYYSTFEQAVVQYKKRGGLA
jgi:hypothetical protein